MTCLGSLCRGLKHPADCCGRARSPSRPKWHGLGHDRNTSDFRHQTLPGPKADKLVPKGFGGRPSSCCPSPVLAACCATPTFGIHLGSPTSALTTRTHGNEAIRN